MKSTFIMPRLLALLLLLSLSPWQADAISIDEIRKSLIRISATSQEPNYRVPWMPGNVNRGTGAGFVIEGKRIVTNAHVVSNARFITIDRENDPKRYIARVLHIAHDCDLAVLSVEDQSFFENAVALSFTNKIPQIESQVSVYGYPIGGNRLSVTTGVVSRVDFQPYSHTGADSHLSIQTNAAINPGNSGGPVVQDGQVVGVAFQGYGGSVAQNVGYMIPVPVVQRFLKDIEDGRYDHYMDLAIATFPLVNPAQRRALGLADDGRGVLVSSVASAGAAAGILQPGDVIVSIDGHPIESDGFITLDGDRMQMVEIVERKFKGDSVKLNILRDKKEQEVSVTFREPWPYQIQAKRYEVSPRYVLFGGLLFQPLSRDFLETAQNENLRVRFFYNFFISDELYKEHPEVVVLSGVLPDPINTYLTGFKDSIIDEVNGEKIRTLDDLAAAFKKPAEDYVIKALGEGRPIVLERAAVEAARERIMQRYQVRSEVNLNEQAAIQ